MRVNKEQLKMLAEKSDAELWSTVRSMAREHGFTLPEKAPSHEEIEKIRRALLGSDKISLTDAARIMNSFKKNK
jgi:hypothetical protein